ncbi:LuxR family two component transcriptional regulator [Glutamicibacter mysorens]|uniref:LuxR family two component transcriptional regulator n=1 Tax=Glutamicibacter mysorens TaxID=257984 RepID=A0ABX4MZE2_9MICC|nr:response regulator transcription factor [Glutamicibacter mysorens]PJJ44763.1 LuxR family two component transcriptional regulator [Glutamicibacter mysorens]
MSHIRIHLADSDHFSRAGIAGVLAEASDMVIEHVSDCMSAAVEAASELKPDVVIMESSLNGTDLLSSIREIAEQTPTTKIVVLATRYRRDEITQAYDAGSSALLSKSSISSELPSALRMLIAGYQLFAQPEDGWEPTTSIVRRATQQTAVRKLSERDRSLTRLVAAGLTNSQIARIAHISEGSVKLHLARIMEELDVTNRVQLAVIATECGLVTSAELQIV